jgi:hypothetical protein
MLILGSLVTVIALGNSSDVVPEKIQVTSRTCNNVARHGKSFFGTSLLTKSR